MLSGDEQMRSAITNKYLDILLNGSPYTHFSDFEHGSEYINANLAQKLWERLTSKEEGVFFYTDGETVIYSPCPNLLVNIS